MAILLFDEKNFKLTIRLNVEESFTPDEESKRLANKAIELRNKYTQLQAELKGLMLECKNWNCKHDSNFKKRSEEIEKRNALKEVGNKVTSENKE